MWNPPGWLLDVVSDDRVRDFVDWERGDDPAQVRDHRRDRVHAHDRRGRALRLRVVLRRLSAQGPGPDRQLAGCLARDRGRLLPAPVVRHVGHHATSSCPSIPTAGSTSPEATPRSLHETEPIYPPHESLRGTGQGPSEMKDLDRERTTTRSAATCKAYPAPGSSTKARELASTGGADAAGAQRAHAGDPLRRRPDLARLRDARPRPASPGLDRRGRASSPSEIPDGPISRPTETVKVAYPRPGPGRDRGEPRLPGVVVLADVYYPAGS